MMDTQTMEDTRQACALLGAPSCTERAEDGTVTNVVWEEALVRHRLTASPDDLWDQRMFELQAHGLASYFYAAEPWDIDEDGNPLPGWEDRTVCEDWGTLHIYPRGVLRLAELYKPEASRLAMLSENCSNYWKRLKLAFYQFE
jgi:hypothetical protein